MERYFAAQRFRTGLQNKLGLERLASLLLVVVLLVLFLEGDGRIRRQRAVQAAPPGQQQWGKTTIGGVTSIASAAGDRAARVERPPRSGAPRLLGHHGRWVDYGKWRPSGGGGNWRRRNGRQQRHGR